MRVLVLNGPNLNLLGIREPEIYGDASLEDINSRVGAWAVDLGLGVDFVQSNAEAELIDSIHRSDHDGIVFNPGAFTHTSRALADAIGSVEVPVVEVHLSDVKGREPWRAQSVISAACVRSLYGRGVVGYQHAMRHLVNREAFPSRTIRYGPHPDNVADLRSGEGGTVILIHGGFWLQPWERDIMESVAVDFARRGLTTLNLEYRRLGNSSGWPASAHDVLMALDDVRRLGGPRPVTVMGHSAGGFLALWAAGRTRTPVDLVVGLAPVTSLHRLARAGLDEGSPQARALISAGAPLDVEPTTPLLLVHGTRDDQVHPEHSEALAAVAGVRLLRPDTGHFQLIDPTREHWSHVVEEIDAII